MNYATFVGIAALVIVTPGQDTALTIRNSLLGNRRNGVFTALGVSAGQCAWAVATSAGIAAVLVAFEPAYVALRVFGAAYLFFLGAQALIAAARNRPAARREAAPSGRSARARVAFRQGLGLFFAAMTLLWLTAYAFAVARAGDVLQRPKVRQLIDAVVGFVLVAFGVRLATERR